MDSRTVILKEAKTNVFIEILKELRPKQWTKNLLVFASAIFAGEFLNYFVFANAFLAFISFCLMASTIYIINDLVDIEKDKLHPEKCHRPIASGAISVPTAIIVGILTFIASILLSFFINTYMVGVLLLYFIINLLYSFRLKHVVIIDVMIIALGFVLRTVAGALAVGGVLTSWFILCTLGLSLFLALGKRRHELELFNEDPTRRRKVLDFYTVNLLDQLMGIITAVLIMFYSMYAAEQGQAMMLTIPIVLYGVFRYYYLIHIEKSGGKPEDILTNDRHILLTVIIFAVSIIVIKQFL
ncbi:MULTISPECIES: decaprenyl-phosphate phosphoribosyltransferase [Cohnella]|uniref:decaprenyl-phosphate phosphoribosyltransferase n=1 Tax=Cohnella TaxID=329857 RepID=UPI0009BC3425|nr:MULTISPECIES: decaprenyl-phosphate phosphoribosyltransferase [Cohnella]MBN2980669.1 decaprenyl-phosphate phosphoribosyltransferase [Cohnella algarum]